MKAEMETLSGQLADSVRLYRAPWQVVRRPGVDYMPMNPVSGKPFRAVNAIILDAESRRQGYQDNRWVTATQAENRGAVIRRGERGTAVFYWETAGLEKPRVTQAMVFNAEQVTGMPDLQRRVMTPASSHDVAQWIGQASRDNRDIGHPPGSTAYAHEAMRTQIGALMLGDRLAIGFEPAPSGALVDAWGKILRDDPRAIFVAALAAERITDRVMSFAHERPREAEEEQNWGAETMPAMGLKDQPNAAPVVTDRLYLAVPFEQKDTAKSLGARWDADQHVWYAPAGSDVSAFQRWLPDPGKVGTSAEMDSAVAFTDALRAAGLQINGPPDASGKLVRVPDATDKGHWNGGRWSGDTSGAYTFREAGYNGRATGFIQNFKTGLKRNWSPEQQTEKLTANDRAIMAARAAQDRQGRTKAQSSRQELVAAEVHAIWTDAAECQEHPYLEAKGVQAHGLKVGRAGQTMPIRPLREGEPDRRISIEGRLLVPLHNAAGELVSLQVIDKQKTADGQWRKSFWRGGTTQGAFMVLGNPDSPWPVSTATGYATGASIHEATGHTVYLAFSDGNLPAVAMVVKARHPGHARYIAGDNDHAKALELRPDGTPKGNSGVKAAEQAAEVSGARLLLPQFGPADTALTDWNDVHRQKGMEGLQTALTLGMTRAHALELAAKGPELVKEPERARVQERQVSGRKEPPALARGGWSR